MQYFGGKHRIAPQISTFINSYKPNIFIEPFLGGCNILPLISAPTRMGSDICLPLITMFKALQKGWIPPDNVSLEEYIFAKNNPDPHNPLTAFIGFGCSFAGKWFGGYARQKNYNFARGAKNSLFRKFKSIRPSDIFTAGDYKNWTGVENCLLYCDPPYKETSGFDYCSQFSISEFWSWVRDISRSNIVLVSEYEAPEDFECVIEISTETHIRDNRNQRIDRCEKVFKVRDTKE